MIHHSGPKQEPSWNALRFEIDLVEQTAGNREVRVFKTMLPMWVSSRSRDDPMTLIEGIHTTDHPLVTNWDTEKGLNVGKMLKNSVHYVSSAKQGNSIGRHDGHTRAAGGYRDCECGRIAEPWFIMTKTIGRPFPHVIVHFCGLDELRPLRIRRIVHQAPKRKMPKMLMIISSGTRRKLAENGG